MGMIQRAPRRAAAVLPCLVVMTALGGCDAPGELLHAADAVDPLCVDRDRYAVTPDVVTDTRGGRLWQRRVSVQLSQPEAARYCEELLLGGVRGWRLPAPPELGAIRYKPGGLFGGGSHRHYCIPSIDQEAFPDTPAELFWTSRVMPDDTAWYVGFDDGRSHRDVRSDRLWVRCVHDPPG
jgi:hypothetical protein